MGNRIIPVILGAILVIAGGLGWLIWLQLKPPPALDPYAEPEDFAGGQVDSAARIEIERLRQQIEGLQGQIEGLREEVGRAQGAAAEAMGVAQQALSRPVATVTQPEFDGPAGDDDFVPSTGEDNSIRDDYALVVLIADRRNVNKGLTHAPPSYLENMLGRPRQNLSDSCQPMTNPKLRSMLVTEDVGPIRVTMLKPAAESMRRVFARIAEIDPDLHARIGTAGSLCVRQIRGTRGRLSSHSFGLSVDLNVDGVLDPFADGKTQLGLTIMADFFKEEGWFWGAGFSREDSMHFEASRELLQRWRDAGEI